MRPSRRAYVDWLRGIAVLCMIEWHVMDAWTMPNARGGGEWPIFATIGGWAAPTFLFLAGVSVPFAIAAHVSRGVEARRAAWLVQIRGWQVFGLAHLFRFQSFFFNPNAEWGSLLRPDILNVLGLGLVGTAWLYGRAQSAQARGMNPERAVLLWLLLPPVVVLLLTPMAPHWWWPTLLPHRLEPYIRPVNNLGVFTLFPSLAYMPVGALVGFLIAGSRDDAADDRRHRLFAAGGLVMVASAYALGAIPVERVTFWTGIWSMLLLQIGVMLIALWGARALLKTAAVAAISGPLLLFGRTSLFVYWVHIELAYGVFSSPLHARLPVWQSVVGVAALTIGMYFAARWWAGRPRGPWIPDWIAASTNN